MPMPPRHHERASYRWSVSTAIYVDGGHARRGAGRALYSTLFDVLRLLGYYKATAGITLPNAASVGLHESFGFRLVGIYRDIGFKFGGWHDVAWYQIGDSTAFARSAAASFDCRAAWDARVERRGSARDGELEKEIRGVLDRRSAVRSQGKLLLSF